jgi:predicted RNA-binding protein YlxR (DUF448 family)
MAKKIPMRQCVGCGEMKSKKELIRVLKTTEGDIVLDATGRQNGRGAYICADPGCLAKARKNHGIERSLGCAIPDEVYDRLEEEMKQIGQ